MSVRALAFLFMCMFYTVVAWADGFPTADSYPTLDEGLATITDTEHQALRLSLQFLQPVEVLSITTIYQSGHSYPIADAKLPINLATLRDLAVHSTFKWDSSFCTVTSQINLKAKKSAVFPLRGVKYNAKVSATLFLGGYGVRAYTSGDASMRGTAFTYFTMPNPYSMDNPDAVLFHERDVAAEKLSQPFLVSVDCMALAGEKEPEVVLPAALGKDAVHIESVPVSLSKKISFGSTVEGEAGSAKDLSTPADTAVPATVATSGTATRVH